MNSSIIAALITAVASIIVALIGRSAPISGAKATPHLSFRYGGGKTWIAVTFPLVVWIFIGVVLMHERFGPLNWVIIAIVTLMLAVVAPIKPTYAAAIVLMLFSENFFMADVHRMLAGRRLAEAPDYFVVLEGALGAGFAVALVAALICRWRGRTQQISDVAVTEEKQENAPARVFVGEELSKLANLHASGALSDEEFQKAKTKVLKV